MNSPVPGRSGTQKVTSRIDRVAAEPLRDVRELDDVRRPDGTGGGGARRHDQSSTTRYGNSPR